MKIETEGTPFKAGSIIVAWSGDGSSSIDEIKPTECRKNSCFLDNLFDKFPEFHDEPGGPRKYGSFLENEEEVLRVFDTII
jgi:hypothetical protein